MAAAATNNMPAGGEGHRRRAVCLHRSESSRNGDGNYLSFSQNTNTSTNERKRFSVGSENGAETEIEQDTFSFLWTLKNFGSFNVSKEVKSPVFRGGPKSGHQWQLRIHPRRITDYTEYFSVQLLLKNFGDGDTTENRKLRVRWQITLVDKDCRPVKQAGSSTMDACEFLKDTIWGFNQFLESSQFTAFSTGLVDDNHLKIHCRLWVDLDLNNQLGSQIQEEKTTLKRKELLGADFKTLLSNGLYADVTLATTNKAFKCHKAILSCRSDVFKTMFGSDMLESTNDTVEITDFNEDVVKSMLEYIYGGDLDNLSEIAPDLMQIAEKYQLAGLKEDCENAMADSISVKNAADFLVIADLYNAATLKPKVIEFINRNKDDVRNTKAFQKLAATNLFVELYLSE